MSKPKKGDASLSGAASSVSGRRKRSGVRTAHLPWCGLRITPRRKGPEDGRYPTSSVTVKRVPRLLMLRSTKANQWINKDGRGGPTGRTRRTTERATVGISGPALKHSRYIQVPRAKPELTSDMSELPRDIPTSESITAVSKLEVRDEKGQAVTFGSLFEDQKTVIIFIRQYFRRRQAHFSQRDYCRSFLLWCTYSRWFAIIELSHSCGCQNCQVLFSPSLRRLANRVTGVYLPPCFYPS